MFQVGSRSFVKRDHQRNLKMLGFRNLGMPFEEMAREFGCSERTCRRIVKLYSENGFKVEVDKVVH